MYNLNLVVAKVNGETKEDLLNALRELAEIDADFNGENGKDYLWEEVKEHNESLYDEDDCDEDDYFDSNMEYFIDKLKDLNGEQLVLAYLEEWIGNDGYWIDYKYNLILDDNKIKVISLALLND